MRDDRLGPAMRQPWVLRQDLTDLNLAEVPGFEPVEGAFGYCRNRLHGLGVALTHPGRGRHLLPGSWWHPVFSFQRAEDAHRVGTSLSCSAAIHHEVDQR